MSDLDNVLLLSPSAFNSKGYKERIRSAFLMLLYLNHSNIIDWSKLPELEASMMKALLDDWGKMKLNQKRVSRKTIVLSREAFAFLRNLGTVNEPCGEAERRASEAALSFFSSEPRTLETMLEFGLVTLVANDDLSSLVVKRTISGTRAVALT
ncbi:hypothetical protein [Hwanghaeella sp. 1Z406]|jgi:hypothetical protein|uniref:hypothetical protein n=1 Tax=Hwanghaeella sp. 1Z406 TaxID=3402811 RepID=UPI003B6728DF